MNSFQKFGSALTLAAALTACNKPDQVEKESTSHAVATQVQKNIGDKLSHSESEVKLPKTIEIAGHTILAIPLESMALTPEQQKKFEEAGGLMNPSLDKANEYVKTTKMMKTKMMQWTESFEEIHNVIYEDINGDIHGIDYTGFELWKKVYAGFEWSKSMTKEQAIEAGLYPNIYYRNFLASKWLAEMNGGHLATLDKDGNGELRDIYNATPGNNNLQKFAAMGQGLFSWRNTADKPEGLGRIARLGSGSVDDSDVFVYDLWGVSSESEVFKDSYIQDHNTSGGSVVVLDK